ncbi:hypothetical protein SAMN02910371_00696 [Butyrivibrio sp. INlla14]|nr:hypothetical protein SAMN02910371_00696 [Butyrivibrio sp. INlla14]
MNFRREFRNKDENDVIYSRRLETLTLLDGKDMDISDVADEFKKDCRKLFFGYLLAFMFSASFLIFVMPYGNDSYDPAALLRDVIVITVFVCIMIYCIYGIVSIWKARYRSGYKGIRGTCENVVQTYSRSGNYCAYHCTTELGEHGIAFVNGLRPRVAEGDFIVYIRVVNHDLIYVDKRKGKNEY